MEKWFANKGIAARILNGMLVICMFVQLISSAFLTDEVKAKEYDGLNEDTISKTLLLKEENGELYLGGMLEPQIISETCSEEVESQTLSQNAMAVSANGVVSLADVPEISSEEAGYAISEDAIAYIRKQLVAREPEFYLTLIKQPKLDSKKISDMIKKAYEDRDDGAPNEGDYLKWHLNALSFSYHEEGSGSYQLRIKAKYLSNTNQEKYVKNEIDKIIAKLGLNSKEKTDYEKVKLIYDYLIANIEYDHSHYDADKEYLPMYAAYSGLQDGYTVCQGYASLFYRISKTVGLKARLIAGQGGGERHGWNIVKVGEYYYNVDATWDDEGTTSSYKYFMKNMEEFERHDRFADYSSEAFQRTYVMSPVSYSWLSSCSAITDVSNLKETSFQDIYGGYVNNQAQNDKVKLLLFVNPAKNSYVKMVMSLLKNLEMQSCDVIFLDIYDGYETKKVSSFTMMEKLDNLLHERALSFPIITSSPLTISLKKAYASQAGSVCTDECAFVLINKNNHVRFYGEGDAALQRINEIVTWVSNDKMTNASLTISSISQSGNDMVSLAWSGVPGASSYFVYRKLNNGNYVCLGSIAGTSCKVHVSAYGEYTFKLVAVSGKSVLARSAEQKLSVIKKLPTKGTPVTAGRNVYKVTVSTDKKKEVKFVRPVDKAETNVVIPAKISVNGLRYSVTEIGSKACKKHTKLKTVLIASNVTKIGGSAFEGCKNLVAIKINGKKVKSVGKNAFKGIQKKAYILVPASKVKTYKKLFATKGLPKTASVRK